jgi:hypothetical protein
MLDVSRVIEIESSRKKLLVLCGMGVVMTAGAILIASVPFLIGFRLPRLFKAHWVFWQDAWHV